MGLFSLHKWRSSSIASRLVWSLCQVHRLTSENTVTCTGCHDNSGFDEFYLDDALFDWGRSVGDTGLIDSLVLVILAHKTDACLNVCEAAHEGFKAERHLRSCYLCDVGQLTVGTVYLHPHTTKGMKEWRALSLPVHVTSMYKPQKQLCRRLLPTLV